MSQAVRRQRLRPGLPAKPDAATKLAVPQPSQIPWEPRDLRPVQQHDWFAGRLSVDETREKRIRVRGDAREFFLSGDLPTHVLRRPASLESSDVAGQIFERWPDWFHASQFVQRRNQHLTTAFFPRQQHAAASARCPRWYLPRYRRPRTAGTADRCRRCLQSRLARSRSIGRDRPRTVS